MPFREKNGLRYFYFSSLDLPEITQAVFTRQGGVSHSPWDTLNLGGTVGDDPQRVAENRRRAFRAVGRSLDTLYDVWQVHSARVLRVMGPLSSSEEIIKADAMVTDEAGVSLFMRFADCVPVLFYDPVRGTLGMAHAGWQGTVGKVVSATVEALAANYGTRPEDILAGIGPSIGPDHYEIGPDVIARVEQAFPKEASTLLSSEDGAVKLDLWKANQLTLKEAGVRQVEVAEICTACNVEDWYSHRAENGRTGRFGALLSILKM
ncbi:MAG: Polyphenol oxidase [Chloroflexi bacterium]|nr:Polyphenol oxidase [Chloroflexota bacterium]